MPVLGEFDTQSVRPWHKPTADTRGTLKFPRPFVAPSRLPHGFRHLDVNCNANIRVKSTLQDIRESRADYLITVWDDTTLYSCADHVFALAPGDLEFLTGEHMRNRTDPSSVHVNFERPTSATDIDVRGFTLKIESWGDTVFTAAQACWIAYPEDREHIFSASLNTLDIRPAHDPQLMQSRRVTFHDVEFWKDPAVFVALNHIDIDHKGNLRVDTYVDGVSKTGLVLHIDTWSDTVLYSAGVSIIAFN